MYEVCKYLSVDGKHRAIVSYDEWSDNPRDVGWQEDVSVWTYRQNSHYKDIPEGTSELLDLFNYQKDYIDESVWTDFVEFVLNLKGIHFLNVGINSQRDWVADCIFFGNNTSVGSEVVKSCVDEYQKFCNGEVYSIFLQEYVIYRSDDGKELIQWETVESTGGVYDVSFDVVQEFCTDYGVALDKEEVN